MVESVTFYGLPWPPSINEAYINRRGMGQGGPGRIKSPKYKQFEALLYMWGAHQKIVVELARQFFEGHGWLTVDVDFCFPRASIITKDGRPKRHDIDNRLKALNDCLFKLIGFDDSRIGAQHLRKVESAASEPFVNVTITPMLELSKHPVPV